jgi:hypothetical protein
MKRNKKIHFNALLQFLNRTRKEIGQCAEAKAYLAGCVLIGAMTEYILTAMLRIFPDSVYRRGRKIGEHWTLKTLNEFAKECGWFDNEVFDASERIRLNRNLLHPNWYTSQKTRRITRHMLKAREDDFQKVYDCITWMGV